ncbi:hypothetical protein J7T55_007604 [Diaporthe amygdali]|uniref:uncharacterized protein n=1 Tax=Phomopsis amygdali TaxID=1214568 RepID=UPI0022FDD6D7|nr:uncharacterized protein J7T55_007604 [Diaporthe amygdali]KAJ0107234.1 hypothetical protein J7T55_007604 [Diaporthe amygdali]
MAFEDRCLRVAMLNADTSVPNVYANLGTFGDILHQKLLAAAHRTYGHLSIVHSVYNVVKGEYPVSLDQLDAVFITASAASSYGDEAWIKGLEDYIVMVYKTNPEIKLFGSCFGHHIICQALLKDHGVRVARHPNGWEIGVSQVEFTDEFREAFPDLQSAAVKNSCLRLPNRLPSPESDHTDEKNKPSCHVRSADRMVPRKAYLQFVHADEVVLPSPEFLLPEPWMLLGSTEHCKVSGIYQPGRVLTLQGHFEFDTFENRETMRIFGADEGSNLAEDNSPGAGQTSGPESEDGDTVADIVLRFLAEQWADTWVRSDKFSEHGDLPTP